MRRANWLTVLICGAGLSIGGSAIAQQPDRAEDQTGEQSLPAFERLDSDAQSSQRPERFVRISGEDLPQGLFKADELEDVEIFNARNEELGEIEGIVIDAKTGQIRYVAVEAGEGFLGIGGKLVAVPWNALQFTHQEGDLDEVVAVLKGDRQTLENAPAIEEDGIWPMTAVMGDAHGERQEDLEAEPRAGGQQQARAGRNLPEGLFRADELEDLNLFNAQNEELGEIDEIVIDVEKGIVRYVAVEVGGGILGIGDELVAVPWDALQLTHKEADPGDVVAMLNVDRQTLENAPKVGDGVWPAWARTDWLKQDLREGQEPEQRQARQPVTGEEPIRR